jgi:hypothetical protein
MQHLTSQGAGVVAAGSAGYDDHMARSLLRRALARPFVTLLVVGAVAGGAVRFVPVGTAAVPGSNGAAAGSTACAVK